MATKHLARYQWVAALVGGCRVLDAGPGAGSGFSKMLAEAGARFVVGFDLGAGGSATSCGLDLGHVRGDLARLPFPDGAFDRVVCFEAIEQVAGAEAVLDELQRVLDADGILIVASPDRDPDVPGDPLHVYTSEELRSTLERRFTHVTILGQRDFAGTRVGALEEAAPAPTSRPVSLAGDRLLSLAPAGAASAQYVIALAGYRLLPSTQGLTVLGDAVDLQWFAQQLSSAVEAASRSTRRAEALATDAKFLAEDVRVLGDRLLAAEQANARLLPQAAEIQELERRLAAAEARAAEPVTPSGAEQRLAEAIDQVERLQRELDALYGTKIMKLAAPARRAYGLYRRLRRRS